MLCRAPLSSGHAYLQTQEAAYNARNTHGMLPGGHDYPYTSIMFGKQMHNMVPNVFSGIHEVSLAWDCLDCQNMRTPGTK